MKAACVHLLFSLFFVSNMMAQKQVPSPPAEVKATIDGVIVSVDYAQPSARGRKIMGALVPYGEVWRTGANKTTAIEFSSNVKIEGNSVPKGKYGLYTIPGEGEWVVIINKSLKWGAYDYKESDDLVRFKVKSTEAKQFVETFTISIEGTQVVLEWENTHVAFALSK